MKNYTILLLLTAVILTGCDTEQNINGKIVYCVGVDSSDRDNKYHYQVSFYNLVGAVIFSETIFVPFYVGLTNIFCPDRLANLPQSITSTDN